MNIITCERELSAGQTGLFLKQSVTLWLQFLIERLLAFLGQLALQSRQSFLGAVQLLGELHDALGELAMLQQALLLVGLEK